MIFKTNEQIVLERFRKLKNMTRDDLYNLIIELEALNKTLEEHCAIYKRSYDRIIGQQIRRYEKCKDCEFRDSIPEGEWICTKNDNRLCEEVAPCCKVKEKTVK